MKGLSKKHFSMLVVVLIALSAGFVYGGNVVTSQGYHPLQQVSMNVAGNVYTSVDSSNNGYIDSADYAAWANLLDVYDSSNFCTSVTNPSDQLYQNCAAIYYLFNSKVADSEKLDNIDSTGFLLVTGKAADSEKLDSIDSAGFCQTGSANCASLYLPLHNKADDADKLDNRDSTGYCWSTGANCPVLGGGVTSLNSLTGDVLIALTGLGGTVNAVASTVTLDINTPTLQQVTTQDPTTTDTVNIKKLGIDVSPLYPFDVNGDAHVSGLFRLGAAADENKPYLYGNVGQLSLYAYGLLTPESQSSIYFQIDQNNDQTDRTFEVRRNGNTAYIFKVDESGNTAQTGSLTVGGSATVSGSIRRNCPSGFAGINNATCVGNPFNTLTQYTWYDAAEQCYNYGNRLCTYQELDIMCKKRASGLWFPGTGNWYRLWTADVFYVSNGPDGGYTGLYSIGYGVDNPFGTPICSGETSPGSVGKLGTTDTTRKSLGVVCCRDI